MNHMDAECLLWSILFAESLVIGNAHGFGWCWTVSRNMLYIY